MANKNKQLDAAMRACRDAQAFSNNFLEGLMTPQEVATMFVAALTDEFIRDEHGSRVTARYRRDQHKRLAYLRILEERAKVNAQTKTIPSRVA